MSKTPFYLSEKSIARIAEKRIARGDTSQDKNNGVIYIIGAKGGKSPYKIGFSKNTDVRKRLCSIQVSNWIEMCVIYQSPIMSNVTQLERRIHSRYANKRIRNEWFSLTKKDIKKIQHEIETDDYSNEKLLQDLMLKQAIASMKELSNKHYFGRM